MFTAMKLRALCPYCVVRDIVVLGLGARRTLGLLAQAPREW